MRSVALTTIEMRARRLSMASAHNYVVLYIYNLKLINIILLKLRLKETALATKRLFYMAALVARVGPGLCFVTDASVAKAAFPVVRRRLSLNSCLKPGGGVLRPEVGGFSHRRTWASAVSIFLNKGSRFFSFFLFTEEHYYLMKIKDIITIFDGFSNACMHACIRSKLIN
jgi:hypothetical protein